MSTIQELEDSLDLLKDRLKSHSLYVLNDLLPRIEDVEKAVADVWMSEDRFSALENAVADIALVVYKQQAKFPTDRRIRPRRQYRRIK